MLIGNKVQILPTCHSTNVVLKQKIGEEIVNGEVICALAQLEGRGQRGNVWESESNKNLTFSFYIEPKELLVNQQFSLNYFVSVGVYNFLEKFMPKPELIELKWPNDIYYNSRKIAGILIENQVKESFVSNVVIGIGLNLNQINFSVNRATSLAIETNEEYDIKEALGFMLKFLNESYQNFINGDSEVIKNQYKSHLLGFNKVREFVEIKTNEKFMGKIVDVEDSGLLVMKQAEGVKNYALKEISFVF